MIHWPDRFRPERAPVHVRNDIDILASPERVWGWLVRAPFWPTWYPNSANVALEGGGTELGPGTRFQWKTFSVSLVSRVEEFAPFERLAWTGRAVGVDVYHAWQLSGDPARCHVRTEESQYGAIARLDHFFRPHRMESLHQVWLESLREKAQTGPPPTA